MTTMTTTTTMTARDATRDATRKVYIKYIGLKRAAYRLGACADGAYVVRQGEVDVASILAADIRAAIDREDVAALRTLRADISAYAPARGFARRSAAIVAAANWAKTRSGAYLAAGLAADLEEARRIEADWDESARRRREAAAAKREAAANTPEAIAARQARVLARAEAAAAKVMAAAKARAAAIVDRAKASA